MNMRRVAAELNVSPRLLYHRVRDKNELADLLSDAIIAQNWPDLSSPDWETRLRNVAAASAQAYADFPGVPASILAHTVNQLRQPSALKLRAAVLQALHDSGLSEENVEISFLQFSVILLGSLVLKENLAHPEASSGFAIDPARVERSIAMGLDLLIFGIRRLAHGDAGQTLSSQR